MVKDLAGEQSVVEVELLESHLLEMEGKGPALMIPKEASKDYRLTLLAPKTSPLPLEQHNKVPLVVRSLQASRSSLLLERARTAKIPSLEVEKAV